MRSCTRFALVVAFDGRWSMRADASVHSCCRQEMTPSPVHPLSPSLDGDERPPDPEPHATSTSPIPTSAPLFAETRQLASSSSSLASSSSSTPSPLFPASPPVDGSSRWESEGRRASKSARSKTSARSMSPAPKPQALPRHIVLPAAPHSLPTTALIQLLPFEHALALVQTLSAKVEAQQADLLRTQKEVAVLEKLALEKGAGKGEVERARVRARADASVDEVNKVKYIDGNAIASSGNAAEWKIELTTPAEAPNAATTPGDVEVRAYASSLNRLTLTLSSMSQVALNLDELAEAISDNAYDFGSPVLPTFALADLDGTLKARRDHADDGASISRLSVASNGSAVSAPVPTSTSKGVDKSAGRARHASLSSRIFGSLTLPSTSSPPPPPPAVPQQPVYDSEAAAPATASASVSQTASSKLTKKNKNRHQRSDSLKSVDSAASARSIVDKGETLSSAGGYGDWIWGKGWAKSRSQHQQQHRRDQDSESVAEEADGSISTPAADSITPTPDRINQILAANGDTSERSTDKEGTPPSPSLLSLTSPSHGQTAGSSIPTSPSSTSLLAPSSPTLSRRSDQDPRRPSITAERGTAPDPSKAEVASVLVTAQHLSPTASRTSSVSRDGPSRELRGTTDEDDDAHPTIRARRDSTGSKRVPPFLSVATPLYSADDASAQPLSPPGGRSYVASAKGTIGRALGLGASASSSGGLSPPTMVRSASEGLRRASGGTAEVSTTMEPNLTLFPRLASMSKYSPFAQPRLSTPSTPISLSSHSSPIVASSASAAAAAHPSSSASMHANISAPTTMELSTLSAEAPPPALSGQNVSSGQTDSRDEAAEPLVDRYGFVYDVKSGMKLLREARRHKERLARGDATMDGDDALQAAAALLEPREPASTAPAGSQPNPTHDADSSNPSARAPHLVRSDSDASGGDAAAQTPAPGPTSMKLLLTTLRDMSNALEQSQKVAWDSFIRRRQAVLVQRSRSAAAGSKDESSSAAAKEDKRRRKERDRARRDRPRTIAHDLNPNDALGGEGDLDADVAVEEKDWTEDLVGVSQMGLSGKSGKEDWAEFKDLVRKGVPIAYRPK